jgi:cellobiose phosphorylase
MVQDMATGPRHQQSNFTVGPDHENYGMQLFSNFTGSLSWYRMVIERMLGVYPSWDALVVEPRVPGNWNEYEVYKIWRNRKIRLKFRRSSQSVGRICMNGEEFVRQIPTDRLSPDGINEVDVDFS